MTEQLFFNFQNVKDFNIKEEEQIHSSVGKTREYLENIDEKINNLDLHKEEKRFSSKIKTKCIKEKNISFFLKEEIINNIISSSIKGMINNENVKGLLTAKEEIEFFKRIEQGDENAKKEFANYNLRLVVSVAEKFFAYGNFFSEGDIIQKGIIGLMTAISKFDYRKGVKFSKYAVFWIEQSIRRAYEDKTQMIDIPFIYGNTMVQ